MLYSNKVTNLAIYIYYFIPVFLLFNFLDLYMYKPKNTEIPPRLLIEKFVAYLLLHGIFFVEPMLKIIFGQ